MTRANCTHFNCQVTGPNLSAELDAAGINWVGYFGGTTNACLTPAPGATDQFRQGYVTPHSPFAYYPTLGANASGVAAYCRNHLRLLEELGDRAGRGDLSGYTLIVPDSCDDGHDIPGGYGGIPTAIPWAVREVAILTSYPAWDARSLAVVVFDEGAPGEVSGCCGSAGGGRPVGFLL